MNGTERPLITIVTCVYNGEKYLERLILSIQQQWDDEVEHLIINDGSTDGTLQIINKYPSLHYISRTNLGLFASMNEGIEKAAGKYICFIHSDDLLAPGALNIVKNTLKTNRFPDGVYGKALLMDQNETPFHVQNLVNQGGLWVFKYFHHISHCSLYIKKEFLLSNQIWFDPKLKFSADYEWFIKILQKKVKLIYIHEFLSYFRMHEEQTTIQNAKLGVEELRLLHQKYGVNRNLYFIIRKALFICYGFIRLYWDVRENGWIVFVWRAKSFWSRTRSISETKLK